MLSKELHYTHMWRQLLAHPSVWRRDKYRGSFFQCVCLLNQNSPLMPTVSRLKVYKCCSSIGANAVHYLKIIKTLILSKTEGFFCVRRSTLANVHLYFSFITVWQFKMGVEHFYFV